jgi:hypothetical protein
VSDVTLNPAAPTESLIAPSGWAMGLCAHLSMTYVNTAGLHAPILALYTTA